MRTKPSLAIWLAAGLTVAISAILFWPRLQPIDQGAEAITTYIKAKRELAERLGESLGATKSSTYRLITMIASYPIGAAVDPDNPADLLTENCIIPKDEWPGPTPWTDLPQMKVSQRIDLNAGLPAPVKTTLKGIVDAGARLDLQQAGEFRLSELSQVLLARDKFEQAIQIPKCQDSLTKPALLVRGVVSGKEFFSSTRALASGTDVKAWQDDLFKLRYDGSGAYELQDATAKPKFQVVTLVLPKERGEPSKLERPGDELVNHVERASLSQ